MLEKTRESDSFSQLASQVLEMETTCLCDIKKDLRVISPEIRSMTPGLKLFGRARTIRAHDDFLTVIKALGEAGPGDVLVIDGTGGGKALLGELFSAESKRKGLAGIVVDGAIRDIAGIRAIGIPAYARMLNPMAGNCKRIFETQVEITCGGVTVRPGDIIFGDDDGIIVVEEEVLRDIIPQALQLQELEGLALKSMNEGKSLFSLVNADEHIRAISEGRESKLAFSISTSTAAG
ncbi:MAG: RraA family protein [Candidatus Obscuribacterales bacterium]|nr:RraA family protein [Candidatus Obscuribacterales bacterium]